MDLQIFHHQLRKSFHPWFSDVIFPCCFVVHGICLPIPKSISPQLMHELFVCEQSMSCCLHVVSTRIKSSRCTLLKYTSRTEAQGHLHMRTRMQLRVSLCASLQHLVASCVILVIFAKSADFNRPDDGRPTATRRPPDGHHDGHHDGHPFLPTHLAVHVLK